MQGMRARAGVGVLTVVCAVIVAALSATSAQAFSFSRDHTKIVITNSTAKALFLDKSRSSITSRYWGNNAGIANSATYSSTHKAPDQIPAFTTVTICVYGRASEGLKTVHVYSDKAGSAAVITTDQVSDRNTATVTPSADAGSQFGVTARSEILNKHDFVARVTIQ
jgi:hypothetical protein